MLMLEQFIAESKKVYFFSFSTTQIEFIAQKYSHSAENTKCVHCVSFQLENSIRPFREKGTYTNAPVASIQKKSRA